MIYRMYVRQVEMKKNEAGVVEEVRSDPFVEEHDDDNVKTDAEAFGAASILVSRFNVEFRNLLPRRELVSAEIFWKQEEIEAAWKKAIKSKTWKVAKIPGKVPTMTPWYCPVCRKRLDVGDSVCSISQAGVICEGCFDKLNGG